jgi:hypothetical protein
MNELFVVGGTMYPDAARVHEWRQYEKALVLRVDPDTRGAEKAIEYVSPSEVCPEHPSVVFKAGTLTEDRLYLCTQTEAFVYRRADLSVEHYITLPLFNDLHHIAPSGRGTLLVAVTGLDMVVEIEPDGTVVHEWNVLGQEPWQRFSREIDYRNVQSTKPRQAHPNFVFTIGDDIWTTRCDLNDAVCLTAAGRRIDLIGNRENPVQFVHDGVAANGRLYFTSVDGHILIVDSDILAVTEVVNIGEILNSDLPLGWCRAIHIPDNDRVIVGFSRLSSSKLADKVRWAKAQVKRIAGISGYEDTLPLLPTRLCCLDLRARRMEWEWDLEEFGMNAVFSIL